MLLLDDIGSARILIDCDKYKSQYHVTGPICDYILLWQRAGIRMAVIEMKGGRLQAGQVLAQIRNGVRIVEERFGSKRIDLFLPLALHGRRLGTMDYKVLKQDRNRIVFKGRKYFVEVYRCGESLRTIVEKARK